MKKGICFICLLVLLTACSAKSTVFKAPDETQVSKQKALVLPPDWELRPPQTTKAQPTE